MSRTVQKRSSFKDGIDSSAYSQMPLSKFKLEKEDACGELS